MPARSTAAAARWQDRFDRLVPAVAVVAVTGVALQTLPAGLWHVLGVVLAAASWAVFVLDAAVLLSVSPEPGRWARGHLFELAVMVATCPLWPLLAHRLLLLELLPAFTVLEATKLAKLVKIARRLRQGSGRTGGRLAAAAVVLAAVAVGALVLTH